MVRAAEMRPSEGSVVWIETLVLFIVGLVAGVIFDFTLQTPDVKAWANDHYRNLTLCESVEVNAAQKRDRLLLDRALGNTLDDIRK